MLLHRAAKLAVIILSVLIILAMIGLVVGGITRLSKKPSAENTVPAFQLPFGAHIVSLDSQPSRLILRVRENTGEEVDIIDTQDGHLVAQIKASFPNGKVR